MEKVYSAEDEHIPRMRGLSHSKSSLKRSTGSSPIPNTNSRSRVFPGPSDAHMPKRVKFSGAISTYEAESIRNGPLTQNEGAHLSCFDGAKTSEFKSFKRLLEKSAHKAASIDIKLKRAKGRDCMEASRNAIPSKSDFRGSPLPVQNGSSVVQGFLSSPALVLQEKEFKNKAKEKKGAAISVPPSKITPVDHRLIHYSPLIVGKNCSGGYSGTMQEHKGTFSGKRACLLQLAARTCSQNVEDFLSNRSDFILEILQRLGIRRNVHKHEKLQNPEQKMSAHQFHAFSSKRGNQIVKFCDEQQQENSNAYLPEQWGCLLPLNWDNTEIQAFPYNHSPKTSIESKHWRSDLCDEKAATLLPDFDNPASAIELLFEKYDCSKHSYTDKKAHTLLDSLCHISEVDAFATDCATYMEQPHENQHLNSAALNHKELFDLCVTEDADASLNSKLELDCSSYGPHKINRDSFRAHCILSGYYNNSESFFQQEQTLSPDTEAQHSQEQFTIPLLHWDDATADQELPPAPECVDPNDSDQFTESPYNAFNPCDDEEIGTTSFFFDVNGKGSNFFTELQF